MDYFSKKVILNQVFIRICQAIFSKIIYNQIAIDYYLSDKDYLQNFTIWIISIHLCSYLNCLFVDTLFISLHLS
ncbi:hypothetical protein XIS1_100002 [Xenorhabdus innexi]|uniref:Uncharacterized protein n=1 Tax=Xenorhabdus innexi TaxID=290109 RepID=A0A1N6MQ23_9GAMM|nr:hypothetical protein XIS1_100002 [Xenorhabdus innexi]